MARAWGAPGVYEWPEAPLRTLTGVPLDVCAFVGVAPRGPARVRGHSWPETRPGDPLIRRSVARAVESWDEYLRLYGGFEGPGLLPYAVASFFEQGGQRAYVVRVVRDYGGPEDEDATAWGALEGVYPSSARGLRLRASSAGPLPNGTSVALQWERSALLLQPGSARGMITTAAPSLLREGSLLRLVLPDGSAHFRFVDRVGPRAGGLAATLLTDLADAPDSGELITCRVTVTPPAGAPIVQVGLGLSPLHSGAGVHWLGSMLMELAGIAPHPSWRAAAVLPADLVLTHPPIATLTGGIGQQPATGLLTGVQPARDGLWLCARSEGSWGNALRATLRFQTRPLRRRPEAGVFLIDRDEPLPVGSTLAFRLQDSTTELREVTSLTDEWSPDQRARRVRRVGLNLPEPGPIRQIDVVEAALEITDSGRRARERHSALGLSCAHPRWLGRVLHEQSELVYPDADWFAQSLRISPTLTDSVGQPDQFSGGTDRYSQLRHVDFFDARWSPAEEDPGNGVHALLGIADLSLLVVPDLYSPWPLPERSTDFLTDPFAGPEFRECVHVELRAGPTQPDPLTLLRLDARLPADRAAILGYQRLLVELAEATRAFIVLLDAPPGLSRRQLLDWRAHFDSSHAAAYHPWLWVSRPDDDRSARVAICPAAVAAGIIARQEHLFGVPHGPAQALAAGVIAVGERVDQPAHDELHGENINVYRVERDGILLTAARTLSRTLDYRQLSVRRIVMLIVRTLEQQMQWTVFESHTAVFRAELVRLATGLLRSLHDQGAFRGENEEDSFFVRCDERLNPRSVVDAGRVIVEIGIAPAEPIEWIVLRLARDADGTMRVESGGA